MISITVLTRSHRIFSFFSTILLCVLSGLLFLSPLYLMFITSLKSNRQIFTRPFSFPQPLELNGYLRVFTVAYYGVYFRNSIVITLSALILIVILTALASYALAKYEFKGKVALYVYFVVGLIVPIRLGTIGILKTMINISLFDSIWSLVIVFVAMGIPLGIFILYDFIRMIPEELSHSARIDGCSEHMIFSKIVMPLTKPALATVAIVVPPHTYQIQRLSPRSPKD